MRKRIFRCRSVQFGALLGRPFGFQPSAHLYGNGIHIRLLYVRTNRIIVPIFAHVAMNTLVVLLQTFREPIEEYLKNVEKMQMIIGGFL